MSSKNDISPFTVTKDVYNTDINFSGKNAENLHQYAEYCIETKVIKIDPKDESKVDTHLLMKLLVARIVGLFIVNDKDFIEWCKNNHEQFSKIALEEYFTVKKNKKINHEMVRSINYVIVSE